MFGFKKMSVVLLGAPRGEHDGHAHAPDEPCPHHSTLEAAGVPVSLADCRNCPNPCEEGALMTRLLRVRRAGPLTARRT